LRFGPYHRPSVNGNDKALIDQPASTAQHFDPGAEDNGQQTVYSDFKFPQATGEFLLRAIIEYSEGGKVVSTQSRRNVKLVAGSGPSPK
jgi:hypothetical protein